MNAIVMAAAHTMKLSAIPVWPVIADPFEIHENYIDRMRMQISEHKNKLDIWIDGSYKIIDELKTECKNSYASGIHVDISPLIDGIEERISINTELILVTKKIFNKLKRKAKSINKKTENIVKLTTDEMLDLLMKETDALSDAGLAWRALQHEYGPNDGTPQKEFKKPSDLDCLLQD